MFSFSHLSSSTAVKIFWPHFCQLSPSLGKRESAIDVYFVMSILWYFILWSLPVLGLCVNLQVLHKAFLVSLERFSSLQILVLVMTTTHKMQNDLTKTPLFCSLSLWTQSLLSKLLIFMAIFPRIATAKGRWQGSESGDTEEIWPLRVNKLTFDNLRLLLNLSWQVCRNHTKLHCSIIT